MPVILSVIDGPRRWLRRAYDWTIHWADTPQGLAALFLIALAESSFFPIPPDLLLIAIVAARPTRWILAAALCSGGSFLGAAVGYAIGFALMATVGEPIIAFYGAEHHWDRFVALAEAWGAWFLAAAAFTPIPFKVATIASGAIEMPFVPFLGISLIGRAARFFLVAGALRLFGAQIRRTLEDNFDVLSFLFVALLVGGFLVLRVL
jgi:membrane protein YqaA with SNARE-associated domain